MYCKFACIHVCFYNNLLDTAIPFPFLPVPFPFLGGGEGGGEGESEPVNDTCTCTCSLHLQVHAHVHVYTVDPVAKVREIALNYGGRVNHARFLA